MQKVKRYEKEKYSLTGDYCFKVSREYYDCFDIINYCDYKLDNVYYNIQTEYVYFETDEINQYNKLIKYIINNE